MRAGRPRARSCERACVIDELLLDLREHLIASGAAASLRAAVAAVSEWAQGALSELRRSPQPCGPAPAPAPAADVGWCSAEGGERYSLPHAAGPEETCARAAAFLATHSSRRSCRNFSTEPVPLAALESCVRAACTAPSGANQQPWVYVVVRDPSVRRQLRLAVERSEAKFYSAAPERPFDSRLREDVARIGTPSAGQPWERPYLEEAAHVVCVFKQVLRGDGGGGAGKGSSVYFPDTSVSLSVGVFVAACHDAGLATLVSYPSGAEQEIRALLQRPRSEKLCLLVTVGRPAPGCLVPRLTRKPFHEMVIVV
eukprot:TRINITY_DN12349_c5_g1_i1.p1 TRINITY_DN12349_c5_g1~~TRINITY_DN12349_c5_g1_i1.p1  ORF type:complete len:337 (+),score=72.40 TRINITY_DN12349_c5_g1_i1:77-1012(+)